MFTHFTVSGTSLRLLKVGERGVVTQVSPSDPIVHQQLETIGLSLGTAITLEQRSPQFVVCTEAECLALEPSLIRAIYVRTEQRK